MKIVITVVTGIVVLLLLVVLIGSSLPRQHVASVAARYQAPAADLYALITDITNGPDWRTGLRNVEVLSAHGEPLRWRETADWGSITFVREIAQPYSLVIHRIADESEGFGGIWTYEIEPDGAGSRLIITERGEVYNPVFRFLSKFVFGHYKSLETYAQDVGRALNENVTPAHVTPD